MSYILHCDRCPAVRFLGAYGMHMPRFQIDAYQDGWRRCWDGDRPLDLCPSCLAT